MGWLNTMRAAAILAVLMIHVTAPEMYKGINDTWWVANVLDSVSRFAVPLFLMITGSLLLHKEESLNHYARKRLAKILVPFLFWSVFYFVYKTEGSGEPIQFIKQILNSEVYYHLWYFYIIIPLYLLMPLLRKVVQYIPTSYILMYSFVSGVLVTVQNGTELLNGGLAVFANPFSSSLAYILLGYAITHRNMEVKRIKTYGFLSLILIVTGTYFATKYDGKLNEMFYDIFGLPVMFYALMIFYLLKVVASNKNAIGENKLLNLISRNSFGIYLVHPILLVKIKPYFESIDIHWSLDILMFMSVFVVLLLGSLLVTHCLSKIPVVKRIV